MQSIKMKLQLIIFTEKIYVQSGSAYLRGNFCRLFYIHHGVFLPKRFEASQTILQRKFMDFGRIYIIYCNFICH